MSFGAQAALYLASKYRVAGVVAIATTHRLSFPLNLPPLRWLAALFEILGKRSWRKTFPSVEIAHRQHAIFYDEMPSRGLFISADLRKRLRKNIEQLTMPVFFIHSSHDPLGSPKSVEEISREIPGPSKRLFLNESTHNMFFSPVREDAIDAAIRFLREEISTPSMSARASVRAV